MGVFVLRHRKVRALIFLLAAWPLLMPSGVCICQLVGAEAVSCEFSACRCTQQGEESCSENSGAAETHREASCAADHGQPSDEPHPPGCPANKKTDNFKLHQRVEMIGAFGVAVTPLPYIIDPCSGQRSDTFPLHFKQSTPSLFVVFCALVI
jgi:hypothetical protein